LRRKERNRLPTKRTKRPKVSTTRRGGGSISHTTSMYKTISRHFLNLEKGHGGNKERGKNRKTTITGAILEGDPGYSRNPLTTGPLKRQQAKKQKSYQRGKKAKKSRRKRNTRDLERTKKANRIGK